MRPGTSWRGFKASGVGPWDKQTERQEKSWAQQSTYHQRSSVKVLLELGGIQSGRHDNELEIASLPEYLFHKAEKDVCGEGPLVSLIEDDYGILFKKRIAHCFA